MKLLFRLQLGFGSVTENKPAEAGGRVARAARKCWYTHAQQARGDSLEGPALMVEKADVEAELLASDGGSREGLLKGSCGPGRDGGCWIVCRWLSELEWDCWLS